MSGHDSESIANFCNNSDSIYRVVKRYTMIEVFDIIMPVRRLVNELSKLLYILNNLFQADEQRGITIRIWIILQRLRHLRYLIHSAAKIRITVED